MKITSDWEYYVAFAELEALMDKNPDVGTPESDRLLELATAIEAWEEVHYPLPDPDPDEKENP